jgi:hypothetical protein
LGLPGAIAFSVATLTSLVLFGLGCWKLDYARRHGTPFMPMYSYWICAASAVKFALCEIEVFHTLGALALVLMLMHTL